MTEFNYEEWVKNQVKSNVYEALANIAFDYSDIPEEFHKEVMKEAVEWFMKKFYKE